MQFSLNYSKLIPQLNAYNIVRNGITTLTFRPLLDVWPITNTYDSEDAPSWILCCYCV